MNLLDRRGDVAGAPASSVARATHSDYPLLLKISIELSYRCPRQCAYCLQDGVAEALFGSLAEAKRHEMMTEELLDLIGQAAELGVVWLNFSGGEPLLRRDLPELISYATMCGIETAVPTKACPSIETLRTLQQAGLDVIGIGLDCHIPEIADELIGQAGYFDRCLDSIRNAKSLGLGVMLLPVITRRNVSHFPDYLEFATGLGVDVVRPQIFDPRPALLQPYARQRDPHTRERLSLAHPAAVLQLIKDLDSQLLEKEDPGPVCVAYPTHCAIGKGEICIRPDGKVYFCSLMSDLVVGDIRQQRLEDIWYRGVMRDVLLPDPAKYIGSPCGECGHFDECTADGRCAARCMLESNRIYSPDPAICRVQ